MEKQTALESNAEYEAFVNKFKPKLTTDDCYTPRWSLAIGTESSGESSSGESSSGEMGTIKARIKID